ncbi:hypothetical protein ACODT3_10730 [Streptomyces sp. 4.24]|uniref:hypothetical protein n=1 Tax=Streptomyces tritrimontium TaxID=3406573 RepID=UPI003BB5ED20
MSKSWSNNPRSIKDFERWAEEGAVVYVINDHATNLPGQFEARTYSKRTCRKDRFRGLTFDGASPKGLLCTYRQVFENPPPGIRGLASPEPDCRDEGYGPPRSWASETRPLDRDELKGLSKRSREASDQRDDDIKAGRRKWF